MVDDRVPAGDRNPRSDPEEVVNRPVDGPFARSQAEAGVGHCDEMAGRHPRHRSSMTALIQIVTCHAKLGDETRTRTTHRRAAMRLEKLPEDAFAAPDARLDRAAWARRLKNKPVEMKTAAATG